MKRPHRGYVLFNSFTVFVCLFVINGSCPSHLTLKVNIYSANCHYGTQVQSRSVNLFEISSRDSLTLSSVSHLIRGLVDNKIAKKRYFSP